MYSTPTEFAAELFDRLREPVPSLSSVDHLDAGWNDIVETNFKKSIRAEKYSREQAQSYYPTIDRLWDDLLRGIDENQRQIFQKKIAIGVLDSGSVNAGIYRPHNQDIYAIFLNLGLIQLWSLFSKLRESYLRPNYVTYCTRGDPQKLTKSDFKKFIDELLTNYTIDGYPNGVKVHLAKERNSAISWQIGTVELFVLCHEIGHFLNGDLQPVENFDALNAGLKYRDGTSHAKEFEADKTGFALLLRLLNAKRWPSDADQAMNPLCVFFCMLYTIRQPGPSTHPCQLDRCTLLLNTFCTSTMKNAAFADIETTRKQ